MTYKFLFNQEDLELLCQERRLNTPEIFEPNDFYGQASLIKQFAGVPKSYSLKGVLEHGPQLSDYIWDSELNAHLPVYFPISLERARLYRETTGRECFPIGFGFLYAIKLFHKIQKIRMDQEDRRGTLVFPSHSTHHVTSQFSTKDFAEYLDKLDDRFKPIYVCIYWKDYLLKKHLDYLNKGFGVVTAGHIYDPLFLIRLYDLCRQFKYSTSNDFGTHLFASVKAGCRFFFSNISSICFENPRNLPIPEPSESTKQTAIQLFASPEENLNVNQEAFVDAIIGTKHLRNKWTLLLLIFYAELSDKFKWDFSKKSFLYKLPTFFHPERLLPKRIKSLLRKIYARLRLNK